VTTTTTETTQLRPPPAGQEKAASAAASWNMRSRTLAAAGEVRLAVHAQWAADLAVLHGLMWESGLASVPDPSAQLDTVAHVILAAFERADVAPPDAADLVSSARATLGAAFGSPVDGLLAARLAPLDHLAELGQVPVARPRRERAADLVRGLQDVAGDCAAVARAMAAAGLDDDAEDQRRRALLAAFEAFLLSRAGAVGEPVPAAAELRWELAVAQMHDVEWASLTPGELTKRLIGGVAESDREPLRAWLADLQ
jgi:hypothetical protein